MVITIDGPAAAGKSTTAKLVARALGFRHIDSGALYRAVTAACARRGGPMETCTEAGVLAAAQDVSLVPIEGGFQPRISGAPVDDELRSAVVTASVPRIAKMPAVRAWVNATIRETATSLDVVVDGRDMGSTVFPGADVKVYLVADSWNRARRRLVQRGIDKPTDDEIATELLAIEMRDTTDADQSVQAPDAKLIDTSDITQEEQVAHIVALAKAAARRR
jgi:cytidylate kinase